MSEKIMLKNVRLSYEHIFRASAAADDQEPKFSATWIIPKTDPQVKPLRAALVAALEEKFPGKMKNGKWPSNLHNPLKDGDEIDDHPEYGGCYVLRSASRTRPVVLGRSKEALTEEDGVIYSGCYCNVSAAAAGFDVTAKKGVTVYLNGVQFVRDGENLSGAGNAYNDFEELEDDDEAGDADDIL